MKILIDGQTLTTYEIKRGIGRVFLALINQLVNQEDNIDWYIIVKDKSTLHYFYPAVAAKLTPIEIDLPINMTQLHGHDFYSEYLQNIIQNYHINSYWNLNPLMLNVFYPNKLNNVYIYVMIHDLIPHVMHEIYQKHWPEWQKQEYKQRLINITTHATHIAAISQCTKNDLIKFFPSAALKTTVIHHGINHFQFYPRKVKVPLYMQPYLLSVGGFDPRKNLIPTIEAFAKLCKNPEIAPNLQCYIVCDYDETQAQQCKELSKQLDITERVKLWGQVSDAELCELYANAELFFFPSSYEGFGLPVLEAMTSGILTVVSDIAVLREIGQDALLYCQIDNTEQMAHGLYQGLTLNLAEKQKRIERGKQIAKTFTWEKTADTYLQTFCPAHIHHSKQRLNIAFVTPWPPEKSGIANYCQNLVSALRQYCDITVFSNLIAEPGYLVQQPVHIIQKSVTQLPNEHDEFDLIVYHLGNNADYHSDIYKLAWQFPGIVVLHDFYLYEFMQEAFTNSADLALYQAALNASGKYQRHLSGENSEARLPMCEAIVNRSKAVIVHNQWIRQQLSTFHHVHVIPHGAELTFAPLLSTERQKLATQLDINNEYVIGMFGFMNYTKRFFSVAQAISQLHHKHYPIKLLVVGKLDDLNTNLAEHCRNWQIPEGIIKVTDYVDNQTFIDLMSFCDVYIGLRKPSMGETSGPLMLALGMGKPAIVSDYQQFTQLPDDICLKIATDDREIPHLTACLESLLREPRLRRQLAINSRRYINKHATYALSAQHYYQFFLETIATSTKTSPAYNKELTTTL